MVFFKSPRHELDPLDVEIQQRAFEVTWAAIKAGDWSFDFDSDDEELEAALRRELVEIARFWSKRTGNPAGYPLGHYAACQASAVMPRADIDSSIWHSALRPRHFRSNAHSAL